MSAGTRIRQGLRALLAFAQSVDYDLAAHYLTPEQLSLFRHLTRDEQLHSIRVLQGVLAQAAYTPSDLALAALLHDVGKTRYAMSVPQRTLAIGLRKFTPVAAARWADAGKLDWWRAPFVVTEYHPRWGAELVARTQASERALWLIRHHADDAETWRDHPHHALLLRLQAVDDLN